MSSIAAPDPSYENADLGRVPAGTSSAAREGMARTTSSPSPTATWNHHTSSGLDVSPVVIEVSLPVALSSKWIIHGCKQAGTSRPKWSAARDQWTAHVIAEDGVAERIVFSGYSTTRLRARVEWDTTEPRRTETVRRVVSAVVTAMHERTRRRALGDLWDRSRSRCATTRRP